MKITPQQIVKNLRKWSKALRSGKYKQGYQELVTDDGRYCCLGVAHRILSTGEIDRSDATNNPSYMRVRSLCGLGKTTVARFVDMNDYRDKTFAEIANEVDRLAARKAKALK